MKKRWLVLLGVIALLALTSCQKKEVVNVYNWGEYIDKAILDDFEKETGIKVEYDNFVTNEDLYVKMTQGSNKYDVIVPSDYMIERMVNEKLIQKMDFSKIPNAQNVDAKYRDPAYDPEGAYSVPYFWGTVGIVYNKTMVKGEVNSWDILWDPAYNQQIIMLDSSRDSIGIALKKLGYSMNSRNEKELQEAKQLLIEQKPLVYAYLVDETKDNMINGNAALGVMFSGDAYDALRQNPDLAYAIPKEGSNLWYDAMVVPSNAENEANAYKFIDYMCRPEVSAKNAEFVGYSVPISSAVALLPDEMKNSEVAYPDIAKLPNMEIYNDPKEVVELYDTIWTDIKSY